MNRVLFALFFLVMWLGTGETSDSKPHRIVSLTLGTDEILLSLVSPDRILAVTEFALDPGISNVTALAEAIPNRFRQSSIEKIVALDPDLIIAASYTPSDVLLQLKNIGFKVLILTQFSSIDGIKSNIRTVGRAVQEVDKAEALIAEMETRLSAVAQVVKEVKRKPGLLSFDLEGWTAGRHTTFDEIVQRAGGKNLAADAGLNGHPKISLEKVVEIDPEIIILNQWHPDSGDRHRPVLNHPALQSVSAVKTGQVFQIPGKQLTSVSHFIVLGVEKMAQKLHPALFKGRHSTP